MKLELFTMYLKDDGGIELEINSNVMEAYDIDLEEFEKRFDTTNLSKVSEDFVRCLCTYENENEKEK